MIPSWSMGSFFYSKRYRLSKPQALWLAPRVTWYYLMLPGSGVLCPSRQLTAVRDHDWLGGLARLRSHGLNLLHYVHAICDCSKDHVLAIQPPSLHGAQEELGAVGVWAGVGHGQNAWAGVLQSEVLICKLGTIDGLAASAISGCEVTTLPSKNLAHDGTWWRMNRHRWGKNGSLRFIESSRATPGC